MMMKIFFLLSLSILFSNLIVLSKGSNVEGNIPFEIMKMFCFSPNKTGNYVVENDTDYYSLFRNDYNNRNCGHTRPPYIDFSEYFLIRIDPLLGGCKKPTVKVDIVWKEKLQTNININIVQFGRCYRLWYERIWIKIPKKYYKEDFNFNVYISNKE